MSVLQQAADARAAAIELAAATRAEKDAALLLMAELLAQRADEVVTANAVDVDRARTGGSTEAMIDRLTLTRDRVAAMADGLRQLAALPDPVGDVVRGSTLANGLELRQVRVPFGVVGVIYEIGRSSRFLDRLIDAGLPRKSGDETHSSHFIDLTDGLTDTAAYYTYAGSLTTPPCSETVTWFVLKHPATLSKAQFKAFNGILGNNFRPLQDRNGRVVRSTVGHDHDHDD